MYAKCSASASSVDFQSELMLVVGEGNALCGPSHAKSSGVFLGRTLTAR
jgi:hypothetical protein